MSEKFITNWFHVGLSTEKVKEQPGFVGAILGQEPEEKLVVHNRVPDMEHYAEQLNKIYNDFDRDGYEVVNVVPVSLGSSEACHASSKKGPNYIGDTGFSITRGAVVVGKKRDD